MVSNMRKQFALLIGALLSVLLASASLAEPPAHAPAHGWRKKHDPGYVGYTGTTWERDYDISSGHCNREEIGAVLGGVVGGVVGSRVGSDGNRTVATIIGVAAGALIGSRIGRELDESDRGCFGHALEIGEPGRRVTWSNPNTGVSYSLLPAREPRPRTAVVAASSSLPHAVARKRSAMGPLARTPSAPGAFVTDDFLGAACLALSLSDLGWPDSRTLL
jgi:hypothetical protein